MNTPLKKVAWIAALALPAVFAAQSASAVVVDQWDYHVDNAFIDWTPESAEAGAVTGSNDNAEFGAPTTLSWGLGDSQSSIDIDSTVSGSDLVTNGSAVDGGTFTHNNFSITDPNNVSLASFSLITQLQLTPNAPDDASTDTETVGPIVFDALFFESPNVSGDCGFESTSQCDDIFVLTSDPALDAVFDYDGETYTVSLDIQGLGGLTADQCTAAGANEGCMGFLTEEGLVSQFESTFGITVARAEVPEPGTLGLPGLGLLGVGVAARRARRNKA